MLRRPPKNRRSKRVLQHREPKLEENPKTTLFLRGSRTSEVVSGALRELYQLAQPHAVRLSKRNQFHPFEGVRSLEFLGFKNDASLFVVGSHQKKRPHNLTIGRLFNFQELDMVELGVTRFEVPVGGDIPKGVGVARGGKPLLVFLGSHFDVNPGLKRVANLLTDLLRGPTARSVNLAGLDHVVCVVAKPDSSGATMDPQSATGYTLLLRHYAVLMKKGDSEALPRVELVDVGPTMDLVVRRTRLASPELFARACRLPREVARAGRLPKNLRKDGLANVRGQIHVGAAKLERLALRRFKAHRAEHAREKAERRR
eukprot:RCo042623